MSVSTRAVTNAYAKCNLTAKQITIVAGSSYMYKYGGGLGCFVPSWYPGPCGRSGLMRRCQVGLSPVGEWHEERARHPPGEAQRVAGWGQHRALEVGSRRHPLLEVRHAELRKGTHILIQGLPDGELLLLLLRPVGGSGSGCDALQLEV
jgi:hypothetical protein